MSRRVSAIAVALFLVAVSLVSFSISAPPPPPTWTPIPPMPAARAYFGIAELNGKIYVAGGLNNSGMSSQVLGEMDIYDPATNAWVRGPDLPMPRWGHVLVAASGRIYAAGGSTDATASLGMTRAVDVLDPGTGQWASTAPMPETRMWPAGFALGSPATVQVWGGSIDGSSSASASRFVYSVPLGTWSVSQGMPFARSNFGVTVMGDTVFLTGGWRNLPNTTAFRATPETFEDLPPMTHGRGAHASAPLNGEVFVVGGVTADTTEYVPSTTVESYLPAARTWVTWEPYPIAVHSPGAVSVGGILYAMGGVNANGCSARAFYLEFIGSPPPPGPGLEWILVGVVLVVGAALVVAVPMWRRKKSPPGS